MHEDREPAPEPLRIIEALVNTRDIEAGGDAIDSVEGLSAWLAGQGYGARVEPSDVRRAADAREGLRELLAANAGLNADEEAISALNRVLAPVSMGVEVTLHGIQLECAEGGLDQLLADVSQGILEAQAGGTWSRLKVCRADDCRWAFYDRSKNRSGAWCTMAECGSREKVRAYRSRHAAQH